MGESDQFPSYYALCELQEWGIPLEDLRLVSPNASYHKKQQHIWFRGGNLNAFWDMKPKAYNVSYQKGFFDIKPYVNWGGGGHTPWDCWCHWMHLIIMNNSIYSSGVGIWTVSDILSLIWDAGEGGGEGGREGRDSWCNWMRLIIRNKNIYMV